MSTQKIANYTSTALESIANVTSINMPYGHVFVLQKDQPEQMLESLTKLYKYLDGQLTALSQTMYDEGPASRAFHFARDLAPILSPVFARIELLRLGIAGILPGEMPLQEKGRFAIHDSNKYRTAATFLESMRNEWIVRLATDDQYRPLAIKALLIIQKLEQLCSMHQSYLNNYYELIEMAHGASPINTQPNQAK